MYQGFGVTKAFFPKVKKTNKQKQTTNNNLIYILLES